ncbi:MAG TPA: hypothetical protein VK789_12685 [Bryobacteraceae bacterium]|nr:hypothetical protein [Bryobacteraceae bacterium]
MRSTRIAISAAAGFLVLGAVTGHFIPKAHASTGPIPLNCNRACLEGLVDQYLAALVAHDPKRLPLSADVVYTENDQVIQIGDGFWKTVEGMGNYKHIFADPELGQVALMGTMREAGAVLFLSLRLRIQLGRITEIESVYYRTGGGGPSGIATLDMPGYKPEDLWFKSIPPAQRLSRQEMISVADAYFSGLQKNDGKGVNGTGTYPFTNDCHRIENGAPTTNVPRPANEPKDAINGFALDCLSQFKLGYYFVVQSIHHRRYPLVDAERGVVWSHAVFDQGTVNSGVLSDGRPYSFKGFNRPSSILVTEAFLIENGKIRRVEMIGPSATYHLNSAWPGGLTGN